MKDGLIYLSLPTIKALRYLHTLSVYFRGKSFRLKVGGIKQNTMEIHQKLSLNDKIPERLRIHGELSLLTDISEMIILWR